MILTMEIHFIRADTTVNIHTYTNVITNDSFLLIKDTFIPNFNTFITVINTSFTIIIIVINYTDTIIPNTIDIFIIITDTDFTIDNSLLIIYTTLTLISSFLPLAPVDDNKEDDSKTTGKFSVLN